MGVGTATSLSATSETYGSDNEYPLWGRTGSSSHSRCVIWSLTTASLSSSQVACVTHQTRDLSCGNRPATACAPYARQGDSVAPVAPPDPVIHLRRARIVIAADLADMGQRQPSEPDSSPRCGSEFQATFSAPPIPGFLTRRSQGAPSGATDQGIGWENETKRFPGRSRIPGQCRIHHTRSHQVGR